MLPAGGEHLAEGEVRGQLTGTPRGSNGFGYDPIFLPDGSELTTAQMSAGEKDEINHTATTVPGGAAGPPAPPIVSLVRLGWVSSRASRR